MSISPTTGDAEATIDATLAAGTRREAFAPEPGAQLGRYTLIERIGRGAMGQVFAAYDAELDRKVALKIVAHERDAHGDSRREAQALAKVSHPHVVTIHDVGDFDGGFFIAMEYLPGGTLADRANERRRRRVTAVLDDFIAAGRGLEAAHEAGLVHRDFKPANVLFDAAGRAKVADFGLARSTRADEATPPTGPQGTPAYMAPEQFEAEPIDARADQFSFCVALHEALAGERPFAGDTVMELVSSILTDEPRELTATGVTLRMKRAIRRGLRRDPERRHPSMHELLGALDPRRRSRRIKQGLGVATVVAAVGLTAAVLRPEQPPPCDGGAAAIAEHWNEPRSARVHAQIAASGTARAPVWAERTVRALDEYAADWAEAYDAACRVRQEPPTPEDRRRHLCLMRGRESVASVLGLIEEGVALDSATELASMLVEPGACERRSSDAVDELLSDRTRVPAVIEIIAAVDRANTERRVGRHPQAMKLGEQTVTQAREVGAPYLIGTALSEYGMARMSAGELARADALLREAFEQAILAGDLLLQSDVADRQLQLEMSRGDYDACTRWYGIALSTLRAGGIESRPRVSLSINYARCLDRASDAEGAQALLEEALARCQQLDPREDQLCGDVAQNLGSLNWRENNFERAVEYLDMAEALWPDDLERSDPRSVSVLSRRTVFAEHQGDLASAAKYADELVEIHRDSRGPNHPDTVYHLLVSATFQAMLGHEDRARARLDEASVAIEQPTPEQPVLNRIMLHNARALFHEGRGEHERELEEFEAQLRLIPAQGQAYAATEVSRAAVLLVMGRLEEGEAEFEAVVNSGELGAKYEQEARCWWSIAAAARGDPATARARFGRGSRATESPPRAWSRCVCEVAALSAEQSPDRERVDAAMARARKLRPAAKATHELFADALRRR